MIAVFALLLSFAVIYGCILNLKLRIEKESERAREAQAKQILTIARASLPYLRQGLDISTATKVAETILNNTRVDAVALTNTKKVLGFKGTGSDHHYPGQKIQTKATKEAISECRTRIVLTKEEIGCPVKDCRLNAAIIVPLRKNDRCTATLKLYYNDPKSVSQADIALAEGLAHLLEIQLELSELSRLEYLACEAELKALQSQINPHFFFNVLNTAVSYCRRNPKEAREILLNFSNFFRATIEHGEEPLISLDAEMALIKNYIELESSRFEDSLVFNDLLSEGARRWKVPPFTLQPIVENAIQHAFVPGKTLVINVRDYSTPDLNIIEIEDNGAGIPEEILPTVLLRGKGQGMGVGLSLVHERLKLLYGSEYGLSIESRPGKGTKVRVILPSRTRVSLANRLSTK
jgi:LytS/YehU family sensor histidine kinase